MNVSIDWQKNWLTEKEYLIDLDGDLYFKSWFFSSKKYPNHDFI